MKTAPIFKKKKKSSGGSNVRLAQSENAVLTEQVENNVMTHYFNPSIALLVTGGVRLQNKTWLFGVEVCVYAWLGATSSEELFDFIGTGHQNR